ncbi:MAG: hypothetical protein M0Z37_05975 [Nitrospiraceae bacterium]|nr:hypothetical protein [Nitrospiraceae bacterium]
MLKRVILISSAIFSLGFPVGAWAMNPADVFLNQKMDASEKKLLLAEKAKGMERQNALAAQIKMIKTNNRIMKKEMNALMKESMKMGRMTTIADIIRSDRRMEEYNLLMNKMMDQMIRDESLLLKIIQKK